MLKREFALIASDVVNFFGLGGKVKVFGKEGYHFGRLGACAFSKGRPVVYVVFEGHTIISVLNVLCHELVHAVQMLEKRLVLIIDDNGGVTTMFEGELYDYNGKNATWEEYIELPWEIEAFRRGPEMLLEYIQNVEDNYSKEWFNAKTSSSENHR